MLYGSFDTVLHDEKYDAPGKGIVMMRCPWVEESYDKAVPEPEEDEFDAAHAEFFQKVVDVVRTAMPKGQIDVELTLASCPETAEKGIRIA